MLVRGAFALYFAALARAQSVALQWPVDFFQPFNRSGPLAKEQAVKFEISIPQFPTQVDLSGLYSPITTTVQCAGCGSGLLGACLTVYSGSGPNSTCDRKICDDKPHTCSEALPLSNTAPSTYTLVVADENVFKNISYSLSMSTGCANTSRALDRNVCSPVLSGTYPTACVFAGGAAVGNQTVFGVEGCSCIADAAAGGCSFCWDGSPSASCNATAGVQECAPPNCKGPA